MGWDLVSTDVSVVNTPLFHTGGFNVLATPLFHLGGTVVLARRFDPAETFALIARERLTVFFGVPTMFEALTADPGWAAADFSSLRFCVSGGAPCPVPLIARYGAEKGVTFRQGYGLTEVGPNCFTLPPEDAVRKAGSVGKPNFHSDALVVDDEDRPVSPGAVGELCLRGDHVCLGYWQRPEETAAALRGGWFHTGDLVRVDEEGYYSIVDRKTDLIISGGENIYPAEVEAALYGHPAVAAAAVIGVPDARWGEVGRAVVAPRPGATLTEAELLAHCAGRLARYKIPKSVVIVDALPQSPVGKILKREVKALYGGEASGRT